MGVSRINVLVASVLPDLKAEVIAEAVAARQDMNLVEGRCVSAADVDALLASIPESPQCALVVVGRPADTDQLAERWLADRADIVVMHVDVVGDVVRIDVRAPRLDPLLNALRELVERVGAHEPEVVVRPLLQAAVDWVHQVLRDAVGSVSDDNGDVHGLSVTRATLLQSLDAPERDRPRELIDADAAFDRALAAADAATEPLAVAARAFDLTPLEFRMMVLALAPELDLRFQRCIGFLLDEMGRRVGTMALYSSLLGATAHVRGALARWLVFEGSRQSSADEPLRLDPFLAQWLLGDRTALAHDPRVRRSMRLVPWPGAGLLEREADHAASLIGSSQWLVLGGDDPAAWRALIELGARSRNVAPIRVETSRLANVDIIDIEDCARRLGRMALLTGQPLIVDAASEGDDDALRLFLASLNCQPTVICRDAARMVRLLGSTSYELIDEPPLTTSARVAAVRAAATGAGAYLSEESAAAIANRYPLSVDGLEQAMRLASSRTEPFDPLVRFTSACSDVAAEGVSQLAERIEPIFSLDDVVLPPDRKQQLTEIVDHVRLAPQVLDEWKFRDQLPYGRGVTALFHGSSGTGKTMAAMGVARKLGIQLLRLDFSRVVSKYIGDTEKNIDRVFTDAQRSGSAILIDEADALLGKRSEVKDAHDRYANIEVAYLLQRMEAYEGLAILTTNMRQNLDPAFLRRLRFVVDFPRPDVEARQKIWRQCLPEESHELDQAAFGQLARKIDLTGGHIRQITLRAAFIAAAAGAQIGLEHIVHAARAEFAKLGMPPVEIDLSQTRRAA